MRGAKLIKVIVSASLVMGLSPSLAYALEDEKDAAFEQGAVDSGSQLEGLDGEQDVTSGDESDDGSHDALPPVDDEGEGGLVVPGDEGDADDSLGDGVDDEPLVDATVDEQLPTDALAEPSAERSDEPEATESSTKESVRYTAHVARVGWQGEVSDGTMAGTTGRGLSLQCLKLKLEGLEGSIAYQAHVSQVGWQGEVSDGAEAGTTGRGLAIEALRIRLDGAAAETNDVYYRVHSANIGWLGWARNGEPAGSAGFANGIEAIEVKLVPKGTAVEGYGTLAFKGRLVSSEAHVSNIGWRSAVYDGATAGTTGRSLALEAVQVSNASTLYAGAIVGQGYVQRAGWQEEVRNGTVGTTGQSRSLQAVRFRLEGALGEAYDVYYRAHVAQIGWLGWAQNGANAGSVGYDLPIEAVQVMLVQKGGKAPGATSDCFRSRGLNYQAHSANVGWMSSVTDKGTAGTTGRSLALEALCVSLGDQAYAGSIVYQAHVSNVGWQNEVRDGAMAGTTGRGLAIEAVRIKLEGEMADRFDVYYRIHCSSIGWLDWASNGAVAGSTGCALKAEAVQIALVAKGGAAPGPTASPSRSLSYSYKANVAGSGWQESVSSGSTSGTTGRGAAVQQVTMTASGSTFGGGIQYAVHSANIGWQDYVNDGAVAGTEGRQIEALRVRLTGELSQRFDVYYRVHVSNIGWLGWAKNGAEAGTVSFGYAVEAYQVVLRAKGASAPGSTSDVFRSHRGAVKRSDGSYDWYDSYGKRNRSSAINNVMATAHSLLGVPYVWLGVYPQDGGMDCASFTWYLYKQLGIDIGFETYDQMHAGYEVGFLSRAKPGDLILMYYGSWPNYDQSLPEHVVLYAGNGMIYEEPTFGGRCQYVPLSIKGATKISIRRIIHD